MIPCSPPKMFVSIAGHASFHTAGSSGPSMIDLSYRDLTGGIAGAVVAAIAAAVGVGGAGVGVGTGAAGCVTPEIYV